MSIEEILPHQVRAFRQKRHYLSRRAQRESLTDVVRNLCGIQAQVMSCAEIALWARVDGLQRSDVADALLSGRSLVKTWCMRQTLHLLPAADAALYSAALSKTLTNREQRWLEHYGIGADEYERVAEAVRGALAMGPLTRAEIACVVASKAGEAYRSLIEHSWGGLLKRMSIAGEVCFGPPRGSQVTFVLCNQWQPGIQAAGLACEPISELLRRYLRAYGPARLQDFAFWAGISVREAAAALSGLGDGVRRVSVGGLEHLVLDTDLEEAKSASSSGVFVRLLPAFDVYLLAHSNKCHLVPPEHYKRVFRQAGWVSPVVLVDGVVAGVWSHKKGRQLSIEVNLFHKSTDLGDSIEAEADSLGCFMGFVARLTYA